MKETRDRGGTRTANSRCASCPCDEPGREWTEVPRVGSNPGLSPGSFLRRREGCWRSRCGQAAAPSGFPPREY